MSLQSPLSAQGVIARENRFGSKNYAPLPVVLAKGVGAHLSIPAASAISI